MEEKVFFYLFSHSATCDSTMRPICSHCGTKGHNSGTCMTGGGGGGGGGGGDGDGERGIMLFGVRVTPSPSFTRRSISMTNLTQLNGGRAAVRHSNNPDDGYFSDVPRNRRPRRGKPWTEEEHRRFLRGLHALGKGEWRGISRYYVKTRTSTQVASHAQKYFLRLNCLSNRRRRGPSLFDITTDSIAQENSSMESMKIQIIETDMIGLTATLPISGESSRGPSSGSSMLIPPTLRMINLSIDDETAAPELFLSLAMPSSPSSSDESSFD